MATIDGTAGQDTLDGTNGSDVINGLGDDDILNGLGGNDTINGGAGDDTITGGSGNDFLDGGEGSDTYLVSGPSEGFDTYDDTGGVGTDIVQALTAGTVIGLNGLTTGGGIEQFVGHGGGTTIIKDVGSSRTLDFSDTTLINILEINANGGNDIVTASNQSDASYRGGSGNDTLNAGTQTTTWLYDDSNNGYDTFNNGAGDTTALAEEAGTTIGINGYINGVDTFQGHQNGDDTTIIKDVGSSRTLDFSDTTLNDILEINANGGNDIVTASNQSDASYRGGSGNDTLNAGTQTTTWLYDDSNNGYDTFNNGAGDTTALAEEAGTTIGINGYINGVDTFQGHDNGPDTTIIKDVGSSRTLDFSDTTLNDILEINANGGNDIVTASDISAASYRGGSGNDTLNAGTQTTTWLYDDSNNGYDTFNNGAGDTTALAEEAGTTIGINGYINGVDTFQGHQNGDDTTIIKDVGSSRTLDFGMTALANIAEIQASGGNDIVRTALTAETSGSPLYDGGTGNDKLEISLTLSQAQNAGVQAQLAAFATHLVAPGPGTEFDFTTLGFSAISFESFAQIATLGMFSAPFDNVIVGTNSNDVAPTLDGTTARDLILGLNNDDELNGLGSNDILIGGHGDDTKDGGAGDDSYVYVGNNNGADSFVNNGLVDGTDTIVAADHNTTIGIASGFNNGADVIDGLNKNNIRVLGTTGGDTLDFSDVEFQGLAADFEVHGGNNNDTISTSDVTGGVRYRGGHGDDDFVFSNLAENATIIDFDAIGSDKITLSGFGFTDFATDVQGLISDDGADTVIDLDGIAGGMGDLTLLGRLAINLNDSDFMFA